VPPEVKSVTPQEEQLLRSLAERVNSTQLQEKDPDAEAFLKENLGANPDALYILAQTVLVQNIALERARAQVSQLQQQAEQARQPAHATSFLGSLLGHREAAPAAAAPPRPAPAPPYEPVYQPVQQPYQPVQQQYQPGTQYVPAGGGQPSFLRGAMQTAAGVAAGALAFEGVESVLHGFMGHPAGFGFGGPTIGMGPGMMGGGFERPIDETVVNNYYGDSGGERDHHESTGQSGFDGGGQERHFHESADQGGAQLTDASYNTSGNDQAADYADSGRDGDLASGQDVNSGAGRDDSAGFDDGSQGNDAGFDDGVQDDTGGFDDGGGFGGNDQV
jgi:hypothetical protein